MITVFPLSLSPLSLSFSPPLSLSLSLSLSPLSPPPPPPLSLSLSHIHTYDAAVASNNVMLTVNRLGQLGTVEVTWAASTIPGSTLSIGTTSPITNSFTLTPSNTSVNFTLTATPVEPHGLPEVFAIQLSVTSRTPMFAAGVDGAADLAIIEEWGVVELGGSTFTGLEGGMVS